MQRKSGCEFFFGKRVQFVYGKQRKRKNLFAFFFALEVVHAKG